MKKIFVLDTNVLLHDPRAIFSFEDNDVIIPIAVIEELDRFKKGIDEMGRNARQVSRILDEFRTKGKLSQGVQLDKGGTLRVELNHVSPQHLPMELVASKGDNRILATALNLCHSHKEIPVVLVTKDTNLRIKADAVGLTAEDYETDTITLDELYSGEGEITVVPEQIEQFYAAGELTPPSGSVLFPNQFILIKNNANPSQTALSRYSRTKQALLPLMAPKHGVWGISSRNKQQQFALDLLLNDDIRLVSLVGKAGTGKTLLALAAGLEKTIESRAFARLVVSRPVFPLGKDIGFLPGDIEEKLKPWMQPIRDNLDFLMGASNVTRGKGRKDLQSLFDLGMIEVEPLTYIRGRSMPNQYLIVDEAQNLTPHEIKTIITRAGEGTKIVLTGDPYQIDNPYIDSSSNGLTFVVERFKEESIAGHITLVKGERSDLAELAATLL
ncbi:MAG: PhoH family protein [Nitrospiraceae bacterium]|nr:PhoH family protein [Nitrospiraceae bacterium]